MPKIFIFFKDYQMLKVKKSEHLVSQNICVKLTKLFNRCSCYLHVQYGNAIVKHLFTRDTIFPHFYEFEEIKQYYKIIDWKYSKIFEMLVTL